MNNKFIKRVAAVVLGVAVLSTCAFAAPTISGESYSDKLYFTLGSSEDKVSYIAYASEDNTYDDADKIIAIGQIDNNKKDSNSFELPVSTDLLGNAGFIIIKSGDTSGGAATAKTITLSVADYVAKVTSEGTGVVTDGNNEISGAYEFKIKVDFNKAGTFTLEKLTAGSHELSNIDALKAKLNTTYAAGGKAEINFYVAGAPAGETIELVPTCSFN